MNITKCVERNNKTKCAQSLPTDHVSKLKKPEMSDAGGTRTELWRIISQWLRQMMIKPGAGYNSVSHHRLVSHVFMSLVSGPSILALLLKGRHP